MPKSKEYSEDFRHLIITYNITYWVKVSVKSLRSSEYRNRRFNILLINIKKPRQSRQNSVVVEKEKYRTLLIRLLLIK
jgi:hypothetical protein